VTLGGVVTTDLITRARAGDSDAFRELTEPHRRELQMHCYRMLGSFQDAEDALQDTLLAAWQGLGGFEGRRLLSIYSFAKCHLLPIAAPPSNWTAEWQRSQ
jgi:RNA polymerase sigma-70 factor (ECF subfamily)